jgi:lipopolysaccharide transport system permease protein
MRGDKEWDLEIKPRPRLLDLNFKEVWRYKDLIGLFVKRDFIAQYKQTVLGPLWHLLQPVFTTVMFMLIFSKIARIPTDGIPPTLFYMAGITIWNYFSVSLTNTSNTFVINAPIFGKVYFPRIIMPLSVVLSNLIRFGIQFFLLLVVMAWFGIRDNVFFVSVNWLFIPPLVLLVAALSFGAGIIISALTTKYRDFAVLLTFAVQLLMYATPIAYPLSYLQQNSVAWVLKFNPLSAMVEAFRYCLFGKGTFSLGDLTYSIVATIAMVIVGLVWFNKIEKSFVDTV